MGVGGRAEMQYPCRGFLAAGLHGLHPSALSWFMVGMWGAEEAWACQAGLGTSVRRHVA